MCILGAKLNVLQIYTSVTSHQASWR